MTPEKAPKTWPAFVATFILNDLKGIMKRLNRVGLPPHRETSAVIGTFVRHCYDGTITRQECREAIRQYLIDFFDGKINTIDETRTAPRNEQEIR